MLKISQLNI